MQVNNFAYGAITPVLSYTLSVLGSSLALICTARARRIADPGRRARWLLLASWALGGTGIWVMHFMAMIGFGVTGESIRYDPALTLASLLIAIVVVAIGLMIVGFGRPHPVKIIFAGLITGFGVAGMHYTGMAAMKMPSSITYDSKIVAASIAIAVIAATVALWFTVTLNRPIAIAVAALIMGVAVNGMHFTGMYALKVSNLVPAPVAGLSPLTFLGPIVVFVVAAIAVLFVALLSRSGLDHGEATVPIASSIAPTSAMPSTPASTTARTNTVAAFGHRRR